MEINKLKNAQRKMKKIFLRNPKLAPVVNVTLEVTKALIAKIN